MNISKKEAILDPDIVYCSVIRARQIDNTNSGILVWIPEG
jgi:hypothetical protein